MPHSVPPMHIPRVRPPRFLKGQPRDDQLPQPEGPVPRGQLWVQGKWRNRASNAVIDRQKVMSQQVKKAIQRQTHGLNIYAYYHLRTKQVVYSLTRVMQASHFPKYEGSVTNTVFLVRPNHATTGLPRQEDRTALPSA